MHSFQTNSIFNNTSQNLIYTASPRQGQTQIQDRGVKYSSQSYKSTASNIILTPRQQQSLSPVLTQSRQQQSRTPLPTPTPRRLQEPLSPILTPTPRQQRPRSPLLTPPRHDENALQLQVNNLEVRVAQQANELNDLSTIQAYPTEYPNSLFDMIRNFFIT